MVKRIRIGQKVIVGVSKGRVLGKRKFRIGRKTQTLYRVGFSNKTSQYIDRPSIKKRR